MLKYLKKLISLLGPRKKRLALVFLFFILLSVLDIFGIGLVGSLFAVLLNRDLAGTLFDFLPNFQRLASVDYENLVILLSGVLILVFVTKAILGLLIQRYIFRYCFSIQVAIQQELLAKYQRMDYLQYTQESSADLITKLQVYVRTFAIGILLPLMKTCGDVLVGISILIFLAVLSWTDFLVLLAFFALGIVSYTKTFGQRLYGLGKRANEGWAVMVKAIQESLSGFREIRLLKKEQFFLDRLSEGAKEFAENNARYSVIVAIPRYLLESMVVMVVIYLILRSFFTTGDIGTVIPLIAMYGAAGVRLLPIGNGITTSFSQLTFGRHAIDSLYEDCKSSNENTVIAGVEEPNTDCEEGSFGRLELVDVQFRYPNSPKPVLSNLNMRIDQGEIVGIKGVSGAGKSTLVNILLGLIPPDQGKVTLNSKSLGENLGLWWRQVAYVPQELFILDGTLRENITLGEKGRDFDEAWLWTVLARANLSDLVLTLPDGVETRLGESGVNVSGGQRQRIVLARALYFRRKVLILDEATSALDTLTEKVIIQELVALAGDVSIVLVTHRATALQSCNKVYQIRDGQAFEVMSEQPSS